MSNKIIYHIFYRRFQQIKMKIYCFNEIIELKD